MGSSIAPDVHAAQATKPVPVVYIPAPQVLHAATEMAARAMAKVQAAQLVHEVGLLTTPMLHLEL